MTRAVVPVVPSSAPMSWSTEPKCVPSTSNPAEMSSSSRARRNTREPFNTSDAPASSHSGENPNAVIDPISTMFPAAFFTATRPAVSASSSCSPLRGTSPTSSMAIRSAFFAVASYRRERRTNRGNTICAVSCTVPPTPADNARTARSGNVTTYRSTPQFNIRPTPRYDDSLHFAVPSELSNRTYPRGLAASSAARSEDSIASEIAARRAGSIPSLRQRGQVGSSGAPISNSCTIRGVDEISRPQRVFTSMA